MSQNFPKPYESIGKDINNKVDFYNYATKTHLKNTTGIDTSKVIGANSDLASSKGVVDKLDVDKLVLVPVNLHKLNDTVRNGVVKKLCMIYWLQK